MTDGPVFARIPARADGMVLTATDWAVLHVICLHADKAGHSFPSLMRIAEMVRIRRNHVSCSTKRLAQLGLVRSQRLSRGSGWANTRYEIAFDGVAPEAGAPSTAPEAGPPIPRVAPEVVQVAPQVGPPRRQPARPT
jgi:Helix-turn-helix domain